MVGCGCGHSGRAGTHSLPGWATRRRVPTARPPAASPTPAQVLAALFALCTNGVGQGAERLLGWPPSPMPGMAAYGAACVALAMLAQVRAGLGSCKSRVHLSGWPTHLSRVLPWRYAHHMQLVYATHPWPLQVDLLSATTSPANKAMAVFWGLAGFAAALALHVLQPG